MEAQAAVIVSGPDTAATSATALHLIAAAHLYSSISPVLSRDWLAHASAIATAPTRYSVPICFLNWKPDLHGAPWIDER